MSGRGPLALVFNRISDHELRERVRATLLRRAINLLIEPGGDPDALAIFDDPNESGLPDAQAIRWLLDRGVTPGVLGSPFGVHAGRVRFLSSSCYVPEPLGHLAFIFAVIDTDGICDAAAWCPASGKVASRLGVGFALGQAQAACETDLLTSTKLRIRRDPLDWLRNDRDGIVVVDPVLAAEALAGFDVEAADAGHAQELEALLRIPAPRITFPDLARTIAA